MPFDTQVADVSVDKFDLATTAGWEALMHTWRAIRVCRDAALDEFCRRENAAHEQAVGVPADQPTHEMAMAILQQNEAIAARHGVSEAKAIQEGIDDQMIGLERAALFAPAPTRGALAIKLEIVSEPTEWNAFDNESWTIFVHDVRRHLVASAPSDHVTHG